MSRSPITARLAAGSARLGYLAVWISLYAVAALCCVAWLLDRPVRPTAVLAAFTLTMSVYLLDRVKPTDRLTDPADAVAHPDRAAFVARHRGALRLAVLVLAFIAIGAAWAVSPIASAGVLLAHGGMLLYGTIPHRPRPKDRLIVKNLTVAIGLVAVALGLVVPPPFTGADPVAMTVVGVVLGLHVFADAMLCDVDDAAADRAFGTHTVPNTLGRAATWWIALGLAAIATAGLLAAAMTGLVPRSPGIVLAACLGGAMVLLRGLNPAHLRDAADLRLPIAVGIAALILA